MAEEVVSEYDRYKGLGKSAFILGYTGEVGKVLVQELNQHKVFRRVVLIGRREVSLSVGPEFEQKVVDFEKIGDSKDVFEGLDVGFCCMGTTRGRAGAEGFIRVDRDYVLSSAEVAKAQGCQHFSAITAQGANANSCILYSRVKGEVENGLRTLNFDKLTLFRPAMLMVDRQEQRIGEAIGRALLRPIQFCCPTWITVPVEVVAKAMLNDVVTASEKSPPVAIHENKDIHQISGVPYGCCGSKNP